MQHLNSSCTEQVCALIIPQDLRAYMYCEDTLPGVQWLGLKLTIQFHLELRLTMCGAIPPLNYVPSQHVQAHLMFIINNTGQRSMKLISLQHLCLFKSLCLCNTITVTAYKYTRNSWKIKLLPYGMATCF